MTNELAFNIQNIIVTPGHVIFNEFDSLKEQASRLADMISEVAVTEENIQVSKKMLAAVNSKVKEMESRRISIKKEMLQPYDSFEKQVKEIVNIVKTADNLVRDQLRTLEERERDEKQDKVAEIFGKRIGQYELFHDMFGFEDFIKPQHLNKSTSMKSVELDMVKWLEKKDSDFKVILALPNGNDVLSEYLDTKDLAVAINIVNDRETRKKEVIAKKPTNSIVTKYIITIDSEKDFRLLELFMKSNEIQYKSEKVGI